MDPATNTWIFYTLTVSESCMAVPSYTVPPELLVTEANLTTESWRSSSGCVTM
jgi:hypothetical protein